MALSRVGLYAEWCPRPFERGSTWSTDGKQTDICIHSDVEDRGCDISQEDVCAHRFPARLGGGNAASFAPWATRMHHHERRRAESLRAASSHHLALAEPFRSHTHAHITPFKVIRSLCPTQLRWCFWQLWLAKWGWSQISISFHQLEAPDQSVWSKLCQVTKTIGRSVTGNDANLRARRADFLLPKMDVHNDRHNPRCLCADLKQK